MVLIEEKERLSEDYDREFNYVKNKFLAQDIDPKLAHQATKELMDEDPLVTTVKERYGFNPKEFTSPYAAAIASLIAFPLGSVLPMVAVMSFPHEIAIAATIIAVLIALIITGYLAAVLGKSNRWKSVIRNVASGFLTMLVTYLIGQLFAR